MSELKPWTKEQLAEFIAGFDSDKGEISIVVLKSRGNQPNSLASYRFIPMEMEPAEVDARLDAATRVN